MKKIITFILALVLLITFFPTIANGDITFGSEYVFNLTDTYYTSVSSLNSTHFVVVYKDHVSGSDDNGAACIGTVSGTTISYGSEYVFDSGNVVYCSVSSLDSTHFVVTYKDADNSDYGTAVIGTVSGTTISYGSEYVFNLGTTDWTSVSSLDSTHFVVSYMDCSNSFYGTAVIGTVSGNTISYGSEYTFNSATAAYASVSSLDSTHFVVAYRGGLYGTAVIGTVSGNTISYGSEYVFNSATTEEISVSSLDSTHFVVTYKDLGNSSYGTAVIGTVSGTTISYGSEYTFNLAGTYYTSVSSVNSTHFVVAYRDGSTSGSVVIGTVSGTTISYGSEHTFNPADTWYTSVSSLDNTHFVVTYNDVGNSDCGTAVVGTTLSFPIANFTFDISTPTSDDTITFTDNSTDGDGTITSWSWKFGDGYEVGTQNTTHQYNIGTRYTINLSVTDNEGLTHYTTQPLRVDRNVTIGTSHQLFTYSINKTSSASEFASNFTTGTMLYLYNKTDSSWSTWQVGTGGTSFALTDWTCIYVYYSSQNEFRLNSTNAVALSRSVPITSSAYNFVGWSKGSSTDASSLSGLQSGDLLYNYTGSEWETYQVGTGGTNFDVNPYDVFVVYPQAQRTLAIQ